MSELGFLDCYYFNLRICGKKISAADSQIIFINKQLLNKEQKVQVCDANEDE